MSHQSDRAVSAADPRQHLKADCSRCAALCCVVPGFAASADFAVTKRAGRPCPNLLDDLGCGIHASLRADGFPGCAAFDCFGAGQQVVQVTFSGRDWQSSPVIAPSMFGAFTVMRQLHESLWYLAEAQTLVGAGPLRDEVDRVQADIERLSHGDPAHVADVDGPALRVAVGRLLSRVSDTARAGVRRSGPDRRGADLVEVGLQGADLRGTSLRGAILLGADLRGADFRLADLLGADLRAADVRGAQLAESMFLTQPQIQAARGDASTSIPGLLTRPAHWPPTVTAGRRSPARELDDRR